MRRDPLASTAPRLADGLLVGGTAKARMPRIPLAIPIPAERLATRSLGVLEPLRTPLFLAVSGGAFWAALGHRDPHRDWWSGFATGLASSTYSTIVLSLGAPRIGRDAPVDFTELAAIWLGAGMIRPKPGKATIMSGILMHQVADLAWATLFFGAGGGRFRRLSAGKLAARSIPWAVLTSFIEYYLILPWLQPLVPRNVPFWTALSVHLISGAVYAEYPWVREVITGRPSRRAAASRKVAVALAGGAGILGVLTPLSRSGHEVVWPFLTSEGKTFDREFLRNMTAHHQVGVRLSLLAADKAIDDELRMLGRLMAAQQEAEIRIMAQWWCGWYGGEIPPLTPEEVAQMPGMPHPAAVDALEDLSGMAFQERFLTLMIPHHEGAVLMASDAIHHAGDPRLRIFGDSIRHTQRNQIAQMNVEPGAPLTPIDAHDLYRETTPRIP